MSSVTGADLAILKSALIADPREFVPTSEWDDIMLLLNYSLPDRGIAILMKPDGENSEYASLRGINVGAWRFRNTQHGIMMAMGKIAGTLPTPMFLAISNF